MWGSSDNTTSSQSAEHAHIDLIKVVAECTDNKDVFCVYFVHVRRAYTALSDTIARDPARLREINTFSSRGHSESGDSVESCQQECTLLHYCNFNIACETDIRYPSYDVIVVMCHQEVQFIRVSVIYDYFGDLTIYPISIPSLYRVYTKFMPSLCQVYAEFILSYICLTYRQI